MEQRSGSPSPSTPSISRTALAVVAALGLFGAGFAAGAVVMSTSDGDAAAAIATATPAAASPTPTTASPTPTTAEHDHDAGDEPGDEVPGDSAAPTTDPTTTDPAATEHEHGPRDVAAVWADADAEERAAANDLIDATRAITEQYADVDAALADGFRPNPQSSGIGLVHYPNRANRQDSAVLDPTALEGLVYFHSPDGRIVLAGALYTAPRGELPPAPGGDITAWHSHVPGCAHPADTPGCVELVPVYMLHVWLLDGVEDAFGDNFLAAVGGARADVRAAFAAGLRDTTTR